MAYVNEKGEIVVPDGRIDCHVLDCPQDHEYIEEGNRYVWRVHTEGGNEMHRAKCEFCSWEGTQDHEFLGQAKAELYRHFDVSEACAIGFEQKCQEEN